MPSLLPPDAVRFEIREEVPVLTLAVDAPAPPAAGDWGFLNRPTLVVVDGPGDAGFLVSRRPHGRDVAPAGWDDAVDRAGGTHLVFSSSGDAPAVFVPNVD